MQSALVAIFMSLILIMLSDPRQWWADYAQGQRRNIAQMMGYYNGVGVAMCAQALSDYHNKGVALPDQCKAGIMQLNSAQNAVGSMQYNVAFQTITDGNSYIATTVSPTSVGHVLIQGKRDAMITQELQNLTDGGAFYAGYYSTSANGIVINGIPLANDTMNSERIIRHTIRLPDAPIAMHDGQPFLVTMMY